jgi:hypothetical protein
MLSLNQIVLSSFLAIVLACPSRTFASCNKDPECDDISAWTGLTKIVLKQSSSGSNESVEWTASFEQDSGDILIDVIPHGSPNAESGSVGLIGGRIMITKGLKLEPGYEIDSLDAPVLSIRLLMAVLGRVFPKGPQQISEAQAIDRTDPLGIKYATPSASGYIPPHWSVTGKVSKGDQGEIQFSFALTFPTGVEGGHGKMKLHMEGLLSTLGQPVFLDSDSLVQWTTYGLGPRQHKHGKSTVIDYGAKPEEASPYKTVGDVRAFVSVQNDPGLRDDTKDFTGFWKNECGEPFGLQIKHYGNDGKYSVVFCGPGGCGDPSDSRPTYITGDRRYEVISESELLEIRSTGEREALHRCTKETNPVLEYAKEK